MKCAFETVFLVMILTLTISIGQCSKTEDLAIKTIEAFLYFPNFFNGNSLHNAQYK